MGSGQVRKMATFNPRKSESLNKAPHVIKMDIVKAHVACVVEDPELWPAEGRAKQEGKQKDLSGARAVSCEGVEVGRQLRQSCIKVFLYDQMPYGPSYTLH